MKIFIGLIAAAFLLCAGALAQHVSGGAHLPAHGPAPLRVHPRFPAGAGEAAGHPAAPHVHPDVAMIRTIASIIRGSMGISPAPSARGIHGAIGRGYVGR